MNTKNSNFNAIWFKTCFNVNGTNKDIDTIIDTGASGHNVIPLKLAEELKIQPLFEGRTVTTVGQECVRISKPINLDFKINGFTQQQPFVVIDADIDFIILGMPFAKSLSSVNFKNKTIYSGKCRFPFTNSRQDFNHLYKRQKARNIIYALNDDFYAQPVPIFNINNTSKTDFVPIEKEEEDLINLQERLADRLSHIENEEHATSIYDEFMLNLDALSKNKQDIGKFKGPFKAKIELTDPTPIFQALRPQPYGYRDLLLEHEENMLRTGVVEEGISCWRFNQVLARKKTFGQTDLTAAQMMRPCTDFRQLNKVTKADPLPIPNAQEIIDGLNGKKYFSQFDLTSAYWTIEMDPESKQYTAFVSQLGKTLVYNRLSFGLKNAPSIFTRAISWTLDPLRQFGVYNFVDDVIIATDDVESHLLAIRLFLKRMAETGWKIKIEKSSILKTEVLFLGFIISADGVRPDPERIKVYAEWERPQNARQVIAFVQSLNYYKRFIKDFSVLSAPLYDLTKKDSPYIWTDIHENSFNALKEGIINHATLQFPKVNEPYRITTDWQPIGVGYVLEQADESGVYHPIAFGGRKLSKSDAKLSSYDGEMLAGWYAFSSCERYLRAASLTGVPNLWRTDNRAVEYARSRKDIYGRLARIVMYLDTFNYTIEHVPSKENNADPISRMKERDEMTEEEWAKVEDICDEDRHPFLLTTDNIDEWMNREEEEEEEKGVIFPTYKALQALADGGKMDEMKETAENFEEVEVSGEIGIEQDKDEELKIMKQVVKGEIEIDKEEVRGRGKRFRSLYEKRDRMVVEGNVLKWIRREDLSNVDRKLIVVPSHLEKETIADFHAMGHFGETKLALTLLQHVFIHDLKQKVKVEVAKCEKCQARAGPHRKFKLQLKNQTAGFFNEKIQIDLITMQKSKKGNERALSIVDMWSGYAWCVALRNGTTVEVANALVNEWISRYGVPHELQSDNGSEFASGLMEALCERLEIKKIRNAPYAPFSTGKVEKFNKTIKDMISKRCEDLRKWDEQLPIMCFFYNVSEQLTTGFSPYELATGRRPVMPTAATWEARPEAKTHVAFVDSMMEKMRDVSREVYQNTRRNQAVMKRNFDKRVHGEPLEVGDLVRVHYKGPAAKGVTTKLLSRWHGPYEVVEKIGDKTYVVMMPYRGEMKPRVQNFRNLWKVGRATDQPEEVEMSDFTDIFGEADLTEDGGKDKEQARQSYDENGRDDGDDDDDENDDENGDESRDDDVTEMRSGAHEGAKTGNDDKEDEDDDRNENKERERAAVENGRMGAAETERGRLENVRTENRNEREPRVDRLFTRRGREIRRPQRLDL